MKQSSYLMIAFLLLGGCSERRKPVAMKSKDLGPSVVVIDKRPPPSDSTLLNRPTRLFDEEKEPDNSMKEAQPVLPGHGMKGTLELPSTEKQKADEDWYSFLVGPEPGGPALGEGDVVLEVATRAMDAGRAAPSFFLCIEDCKTPLAIGGGRIGESLMMPNFSARIAQTVYVHIDKMAMPKVVRPGTKDPAPPSEALAYELTILVRPATARSEREPNDTKETVNPIEENVDWEGHYSRARDEDYFKVKGGAAEAILRVELSAVGGVVPGIIFVPGDVKGTVQIRGNKGEELRIRNLPLSRGLDSLLGVRNLEGRNEAVPYVLRLSTEAPIEGAEREPNDRLQEAQTLVLPDGNGTLAVSGFLWANDADTFAIAGPDDATYQVELSVPSKVDLKIERLSSTGQVITKIDKGGVGKSEVLDREVRSATPIIRIRGRSKDVLFDEPYTLTLRRLP